MVLLDHLDYLGHETWPLVKPLLPRAFAIRRQIERDG
jgi:hypothetical protein